MTLMKNSRPGQAGYTRIYTHVGEKRGTLNREQGREIRA